MLAPPYSSLTVMPSTPRSPILRHRSIGNWSLRSISAARGAISAWAKSRTASRRASMSSPSWKFSPGRLAMAVSLDFGGKVDPAGSVFHVGAARDGHQRRAHGGDEFFAAVVHRIGAAFGHRHRASGFDDLPHHAKALAPGRRQQVDLEFNGEHASVLRHQGETGIAAGRVERAGHHARMQK